LYNWAGYTFTAAISVGYSDVEGGYEGVYAETDCTVNWGEGNIDLDPYFVNPGYWADANDPNIIVEPNDPNAIWIDGDYHLLRTSPCIDAASDANVCTDIEGNVRPFDFPGVDNNGELPDFDMGVYEATPQETRLLLLPRVINRKSHQPRIMAWLHLPQGITKDQLDRDEPLILYPVGIEAMRQFVIPNRRRGTVSVFAVFGKAELMDAVPANGRVQLQVLGHMRQPGQYFSGTDTIRIKTRRLRSSLKVFPRARVVR